MRVLAAPGGALAVRKADARAAFLRFDLGKQEGDLGHRLLPAGQHFGVADPGDQRQENERQLTQSMRSVLASPAASAGAQREFERMERETEVRILDENLGWFCRRLFRGVS